MDVIVCIFLFCIVIVVHLALGGIGLMAVDDFIDEYTPLWKPVILIFWPITAFVIIFYKTIDWLEEVRDYYVNNRR